jgi:hypothetical protein
MLPRSGETMLCLDCAGPSGFAVAPETLAFLVRTGRESLPQAAGCPPSPAVLRQVEAVCMQVRRAFLQRELRSYDVIQTMLARL